MTEDPENGMDRDGLLEDGGFRANDYVKLVRNDDYWGDKALTQRITLQYVAR